MLSKHMWWCHCTINARTRAYGGLCSYSASVDVTFFERGCAYCDTGNFLEKSLQRLKEGRPEVKTFLNQVLTAELISKCDSIELVWSSLWPPKKKKKKKMGGLFLSLRSLARSRLSWRHEALRNRFVPWSLSYSLNTFSMTDSLPPRRSFQNSLRMLK